ncbi:MAG: hypothetical protein P9L91_00365, partial [Candidatus Zophobacter franzmannii]|nr:hypothetical protein [Candidatus Zophobacter franzmannii]
FIFSWDINRVPASVTDSLPFTLDVVLTWNGLTLLDYELTAKDDFWTQSVVSVTNRDVLTSIISDKFEVGTDMISIDDLFTAAPALEDVVLNTGLLPDGNYSLSIQANSPITNPSLSNKASINFTVKNANAIFLNQPGAEMGGTVPQLHNNIVVFNWQSNLFNPSSGKGFKLTIKEFERKDDMTGRDLERVGREFMVIEDIPSSVYSGFIPFTDGYYYAWKVSAPISTESAPDGDALQIESEYKVFHFVEDTSSTSNQITLEIAELLRQFGDNGVNSLLDGGNVPTTNVITEESWLSGEKAVKKIKEFIGKSVTIKITEQ